MQTGTCRQLFPVCMNGTKVITTVIDYIYCVHIILDIHMLFLQSKYIHAHIQTCTYSYIPYCANVAAIYTPLCKGFNLLCKEYTRACRCILLSAHTQTHYSSDCSPVPLCSLTDRAWCKPGFSSFSASS